MNVTPANTVVHTFHKHVRSPDFRIQRTFLGHPKHLGKNLHLPAGKSTTQTVQQLTFKKKCPPTRVAKRLARCLHAICPRLRQTTCVNYSLTTEHPRPLPYLIASLWVYRRGDVSLEADPCPKREVVLLRAVGLGCRRFFQTSSCFLTSSCPGCEPTTRACHIRLPLNRHIVKSSSFVLL